MVMRTRQQFAQPSPGPSLGGRGAGAAGFTLIEVILAIAVFSLLAAVVTVNMFGGVKEKYLDEGSQQLETVLRMARAEAANQGRRLRLVWRGEEQRLVVMWEPQPLAQPGQFVEHTGASWVKLVPNDTIRVVNSKRTGASDADMNALVFGDTSKMGSDEEGETALVDFYPDGSCDSAWFEFASRDEGDLRRAVIELDGFNYLISTKILGATELAQWYEQMNVSQSEQFE